MTAAALVAVTGLGNAAQDLARPADLFDTGYGKAVLVKVVALTTMAGLGALHARRRNAGVSRGVPTLVRLEAGAALVALAVATLLVGFPNPPREAAAAERQESKGGALSALLARDALSVAEASGPFIVGLTIAPARPGPVRVHVQILGVDPGDGLRDAHLRAGSQVAGVVDIALAPRGFGCFDGSGRIPAAATWQLEVTATSNRGPVHTATSAPFPAPSGVDVFTRALSAQSRLRSARMTEHLTGAVGRPVIVSHYQFQAPDAFSFQMINGSARIDIDTHDWSRASPGEPFKDNPSPPGVPGFRWPGNYYRDFWGPGTAARILGTEVVDGVSSQVVAFVRPEVPAWFRIWVGVDDGLVRREEMRAEGHLMDHTWGGFDSPVDLHPPA